MYKIPTIQSTELKKSSKPKGPNEDTSIPFRRERRQSQEQGRKSGTWMGKATGEEGNMIRY